MPSTWKFVTEPTASPAVLLDMNDGDEWRLQGDDSFDISPPPLRRTVASSSLADGGLVTSASYDLREIRFTVRLLAATEDGRNVQLKELEAELSKPTNLLMYQAPSSSFPVFFRTFRSDAFTFDKQTGGDFWDVACSVLAEPFAIGVRHDIVSSLTLTNDPASGTNPARMDITGVRGDSPSPAFVRYGNLGGQATLTLAQRTINNPTALTHFAQAEAATLGTDTTVATVADSSGGASNNAATVSFATNANLVTRLTMSLPSASSSEATKGRYRVLARVRASATATTFTMRWQVSGSDTVWGPTVTYTAATSYSIVDLGVLEVPTVTTVPTAIGYSALAATGYTLQALQIQAARTSGSASLHIDYVYLIPADERLVQVNQAAAISSGFIVLDGPNTVAYGMASGTTAFGATRTIDNGGGLVPFIGGIPLLVPGVTNRWYALITGGAVTATTTVDVSYWPRWREVATA